jgi:predicted transcriptional regulator
MKTQQFETEYTILENIHTTPEKIRQRDLAHVAGISLGMTNTVVKRLIDKGLLITKKINHRNIQYAVTPAGINELMRRSYRFLKRTIKQIVLYKEKIERLIHDLKLKGYTCVILVGKSDLYFIFEHCCQQQKVGLKSMTFNQTYEYSTDQSHYYIFTEKIAKLKNISKAPHILLNNYLQGTSKNSMIGDKS